MTTDEHAICSSHDHFIIINNDHMIIKCTCHCICIPLVTYSVGPDLEWLVQMVELLDAELVKLLTGSSDNLIIDIMKDEIIYLGHTKASSEDAHRQVEVDTLLSSMGAHTGSTSHWAE